MHSDQIKRRDLIILLGGTAVAWPLAARAQQGERMRRIGVLMGLPENDPDTNARLAGFREAVEGLGWLEGRNIRIDYRFAPAGAGAPVLAKELVALQPDVILANSTPVTAALQRETRTIPIVFTGVTADPIARLPAVYSDRVFVAAGGLMCYSTNRFDQFRQAASYIDRILRGAKPAELPVQAPTKFETVINLKTAKALGLTVPPGLLVAADEVIE